MSTPDRASLRSPFRSPAAFVSAIQARIRRHRLGRLSVLILVGAALLTRLFGEIDAAESARARWAPDAVAWTVMIDVEAGSLLEPDDVAIVSVPPGLLPEAAMIDDPAGLRARVDLAAGEIILGHRVGAELSVHAARTPTGAGTIALDRTSDLFSVGDRVDLHDQIDGFPLATNAVVVAVTDGDVAIAVPDASVAEVVRGMGRGGVIVVLRSD